MFKMENDPRVIGSEKGPGKGIGNFIRKTSLDEFPQFFNVLKGASTGCQALQRTLGRAWTAHTQSYECESHSDVG